MSRILILFVLGLFTNFSYAEYSCNDDITVRTSDNFEYSATVYVVCDTLANITKFEANSLVNDILKRDISLANEIFIFFIDSEKYIGSMEKAPYKIPKGSFLGDYYNMTQRLILWPQIEDKTKILVLSDKGDI